VIRVLLIVGLGGFIGAVLRYLIGGFFQNISGSISFAFGTLAVNIIGCFVIGILTYLVDTFSVLNNEMRAFLMIGILGAFTTFSTFGHETLVHLIESKFNLALINIGAHVVFGLTAVYAGRLIGSIIWRV
jgi:CrcB protein